MTDGDVTLVIGGSKLSGWTEVDISCGIERMPWSFNIALTEKFPGDAGALVAQPGDACTVTIGGDLVITGYVDRFVPSITMTEHTIRVIGRSKSQDFVDCSGEWPNGQIVGSSALEICTKLAKPYGITVNGKVDTGKPIPQFNLTLGESAFAIAERICRYRALLIFDQPDGSIALDHAGSGSMASGVVQGDNVQEGSAEYSMDGRYSDYLVFIQSMDLMADTGEGGNLVYHAQDAGVKRHRQLDLIAESGDSGFDISKARAQWEVARRFGRSYAITVVVDSWRDSAGALWKPNFKIPVKLPSLKTPKADWLIGNVRFVLDGLGTRAVLEIMPREAFLPEPILLLPFAADVPPQ